MKKILFIISIFFVLKSNFLIAACSATITAGGATTFCQGGSVTLTASSDSLYQWSSGQTTQGISVTTSGSYTVSVTATGGCTAVSNPTVVTVNPLPATPTITASGPTTFCQGGSVTLTSSTSNFYKWSTGPTTSSIPVTTSGSIVVTVTNANGCSSASAATVVTVNPMPAVPTITASGSTTFCQGGSVTLTSSTSTSYLWSTSQTTSSISVISSGSIIVTVTNANGCSAASAATMVTVNDTPTTPTILYEGSFPPNGTISVCPGTEVVLSTNQNIAGDTYIWTGGNTSANPTFVPQSGSDNFYNVTITNSALCSKSSVAAVQIIGLPSPTPVFQNSDITVCASAPTTELTVTAAQTLANYTYVWSSNPASNIATVTQPSNTLTITVTPGASTIYTVTVTDGHSCSASTSASVTVRTTLAATISPDDTSICVGKSVNLLAHLTSSSTPFMYSWNPPSLMGADPSVTPGGTNNYEVTITDANGCSASVTATVTVNKLPVPTLSPLVDSICSGQSEVITATLSTSTEPDYTYDWSNDIQHSGISQATNQITVTVTNTTSYNVTVTDANGCSASASANATIIVNPLPAVNSFTSSPNAVCLGNPAVLDVEITPTRPEYTYTWGSSPEDTFTPTVTGNTDVPLSVTPTVNTIYDVTVTDANQCSATGSVSVTVNPLPKPTITSIPSSGTICAQKSAILTASIIATTPNYTYTWSNGTSADVSALSDLITVTPSVTTNYNVTVTDANGCSASSLASVTITVNKSPQILLTSDTPSICSGASATLTASVVFGTLPPYTYKLDSAGVIIQQPSSDNSSQTFNVSPVVVSSYNYEVILVDDHGCADTSNSVIIGVDALAVQASSIEASDNTICLGGTVSLNALGGRLNGANWVWYSGADTLQRDTSASFVPNASGLSIGNNVFFVIAEGSCNSTAAVSTTINVVKAPTALIPTRDSICQNSTGFEIVPIVDSSSTTGQLFYQWYAYGAGADRDTNASFKAPGANTNPDYLPPSSNTSTQYYFCEIYQDHAGCATLSGNDTVVVVTQVQSQITNGSAACADSLLVLNASLSGGAGDLTFLWEEVNSNNVIDTSETFTSNRSAGFRVGNPGTYNFRLIISSDNSTCNTITFNSNPVTINAEPDKPTISLPYGDMACAGATGFVAIAMDGNSIESNTCLWSSNPTGLTLSGQGGPYASFDFDNPPITENDTVTLSVQVTDVNGCQNDANAIVAIANVTAPANPGFSLLTYLNNTLVVLDNGYTYYQWGFDTLVNGAYIPDTIAGAYYQDYQLGPDTDFSTRHYWVIVGDEYGCRTKFYYNREATTVTGATSVQVISAAISVSMYPNPTHGQLQVVLKDAPLSDYTIQVYNALGQQVQYVQQHHTNTSVLDLQSLPAGFYVLRLVMNNNAAIFSGAFIRQ